MSKLLPLLLNENMKIYRRVRTWIMAGIITLINLLMAIVIKFNADTFQLSPNLMDFIKDSGTGMVIFPVVFSVVIASDIVASEFSWGTVKLLLIRPVSRWKILLSKYIAVLVFTLFLLGWLFINSLLFGLVFFGFGESSATFGDVLADYGFNFVNLLMTVTFAFMISAVFRSSMLAISLSFVILFMGSTISSILIALEFDWAKYLLFTNMDLSIYFSDSPFLLILPGMTLGFSISVLVVYFIVFHLISFFTFIKRDVAS